MLIDVVGRVAGATGVRADEVPARSARRALGHQLDEHALHASLSAALLQPGRELAALNKRLSLSADHVGDRESSHAVALSEVGDRDADVVEASHV